MTDSETVADELDLCNDAHCAEDRPCIRHRAAAELRRLKLKLSVANDAYGKEIEHHNRTWADRDTWQAQCSSLAAEVERLRDAREAMAWCKNDLAYKAPEQLTPQYFGYLLTRIKAALAPEEEPDD